LLSSSGSAVARQKFARLDVRDIYPFLCNTHSLNSFAIFQTNPKNQLGREFQSDCIFFFPSTVVLFTQFYFPQPTISALFRIALFRCPAFYWLQKQYEYNFLAMSGACYGNRSASVFLSLSHDDTVKQIISPKLPPDYRKIKSCPI
jgi:hypothetical protein